VLIEGRRPQFQFCKRLVCQARADYESAGNEAYQSPSAEQDDTAEQRGSLRSIVSFSFC